MTSTASRISSDLAGEQLPSIDWSWDEGDAMLYALGVGAAPPRDLAFVYEGEGPLVMPTFPAVVVGRRFLEMVDWLGVPLESVLHAGQSLRLDRLPSPRGTARVTRRVVEVWDKGSGAVIVVEDSGEDGQPLFVARSTWWIAGAGEFGGERGPRSERVEPEGQPDLSFSRLVSPGQSALHRLSGDRNPIHIDPAFARQAGFEAPILHGLCTLGMVCLDFVAASFPTAPQRLREIGARFASPVLPGAELQTEAWNSEPGLARLRTRIGEQVVLADGLVRYDVE